MTFKLRLNSFDFIIFNNMLILGDFAIHVGYRDQYI